MTQRNLKSFRLFISAVGAVCRWSTFVVIGTLFIFPQSVLAQKGQAQSPQSKDELLETLLRSMVISVETPIPTEKPPKLKFLSRRSLPDFTVYRKKFLTSERIPLGVEKIISPNYGAGTRYVGPRIKVVGKEAPTAISFYFDEYQFGYEFVNNMSTSPAVYEELTEEVDPATGLKKSVVKYKFTREKGIAKAKEFIEKLTPGVGTLPPEFQLVETAEFGKEGIKPFIYRLTKTYRGVPLLDDYIQVTLDGDMNLVNLSYFWSQDIEPVTDEFQAIDAGFALMQAKRIVLEDWNNNPPPLTLFGIQLAFVNHRTNAKAIVPVWVMNLKWNEVIQVEEPSASQDTKSSKKFNTQVIQRDLVLAVDALKGGRFEMVPPALKK